jgi:putative acetyltransferase
LIEIKPIEPHQLDEAKHLIIGVADRIYNWGKPIDKLIEHFEAEGDLADLKDVRAHYFARRGIFLAAMDGSRLIGTGAVRSIDTDICELKRIWLLEEYHGRGIGYQVVQRLLAYARQAGYKEIHLETGVKQERAIHFYERVGFQVNQSTDSEVKMKMTF